VIIPGKGAVCRSGGIRPGQWRILVAVSASLALAPWFGITSARAATAGTYPDRPIHVVVPFAAGTQLDLAARIIGPKLADALGQPVIVENHPGASSNIGNKIVAGSAPDGYMLLLTGSLITQLPSTLGSSAVDPVTSFAPISKLAKVPLVILVHPSLGVNTLAELIALARRQPGKIAYATPGVGTTPHLAAASLAQEAGIDLLHVPYVNTGAALREVLTGEPPVYLGFRGPIDGYVQGGQLKALAVAGRDRMRSWPDIATVAELGYPAAAVDPWNGVLAPAGTPPEIIARLYREFAAIMGQPEVQDRFTQLGMEPLATSPEEFSAEIREATHRWPQVVKAMGLPPQ